MTNRNSRLRSFISISGVAFLARLDVARFHEGSRLYALYPSRGMHQHERAFVVAANTPHAHDHGGVETSLFYADKDGACAIYGGLDGGAEALDADMRIVGCHDHELALANLGYYLVPAERELELRRLGHVRAMAWAKADRTILDPQGYADENWGLFAARYLRDEEHQYLRISTPVTPGAQPVGSFRTDALLPLASD